MGLIAAAWNAAGGTLAVGTMTICSTLMQFALLPLQGLSQGAQPIISFNYGAKRPERVKAAFRILLISCLAFSAMLGLTCIFAPQIFVYLLTPDAALREYAIPCVRLYMAGVTIFGAQIACQQTFVALGNAKCSLFLACLRKLILLIPLVYLLPLGLLLAVCLAAQSLGGVWMAVLGAAAFAVGLIPALLWNRHLRRRPMEYRITGRVD